MPATIPEKHHLVDFASRYASASFKTFNAASALWRAQGLLTDIDDLITLSVEAEKKEIRFGSVYTTYEIISYYSVGLATCLEWHARSRLVDLMLFRPNCIRTADLKGIADLAISQMVAGRVTVPHLLGAATKVSSIRDYVAIFDRLFDELEIKVVLEKELRNIKTENLVANWTLFESLEALLEYRNYLVHEISYSMIGHYLIRDTWSLIEAKNFAANVISCIKLVEALVTNHTPKDFPNRLTEDGLEESDFEKLVEAIEKIEDEITASLATDEQGLAKWKGALESQKIALQKELDFLDSAETFRPVRYYDVRHIMQTELLKSRLAFLLVLKSEAGH
jgi:uncharacterized protein YdcH (DUF465 family)